MPSRRWPGQWAGRRDGDSWHMEFVDLAGSVKTQALTAAELTN
jgi:hypothetical protein